ncbi:cadherin repeat domain-containing protein [Colwellia sp. E2M01]|uniref:cadherin repeat domain-containing protein n=1 Tax=Colwellia sp. E2M01 TaxID=2841561 RepID=UPI001C08FD42|nr:cadherin repeat domain-containing protein [Colwellia sp. E2M01]MBU2869322.1 cadherin repeat domain-containing protein [Colwellia sp. E2M01]
MLLKTSNNLLPLTLAISSILLTACNSDDKNTAPQLTGDLLPVVAENTVLVGQYTATDADNDTITLSLNDTNNLFSIDQSGVLSFNEAPDYDDGEIGPFNLTIIATDDGEGALSSSIDVAVTVGDVKDTPSVALVQTVAPDYTNSEVAYLDAKDQQVASGYYVKDASDYTLSTYKGDVFHIGRYFIDTIEKYSAVDEADRDTLIWSYSTQDAEDSTSRNTYALVSLNETKAYLIRYGSSKVWIVNPQATTSEDFKTGEIDLTSYVPETNTSGTPSPSSAVINDGKLYIAMQRIDDTWTPGVAYVAVFDTATDTEIETNANDEDSVKGIPLTGVNPLEHSLVSNEDKVFVTTRNSFGSTDLSFSRIEEINTGDYSVRQVLDAADIDENTASYIQSSVVVSSEKGYFYASEAIYSPSYHEVSSIYEFNPTTGDIVATGVADTGTEAISFIGLDAANFLWVSVADPMVPGVDIIDTNTNSKRISRLATTLNPGTIRFIEE